VGAVLVHTLIDIDPQYPAVSAARREELLVVKGELEAQAPEGAAADPYAAKTAKQAAKTAKQEAKRAKKAEKAEKAAASESAEATEPAEWAPA
jgi:hypothetical protein